MNNKIGRWQGAGLLTTTLLGTSVFILPQMTVDIAGSWSLFAWILLTISIIPVAWVFAKLSGVLPHSAGPAFFVEKAFGETAGKTIGLIFLFAVPLGAPAALLMTYQFVEAIFHTGETVGLFIQLGFLVLIFLLNVRGIQLSASLQLGLTLTITGVVVAMVLGAVITKPDNAVELVEMPFSSTFAAAGLAFWSFLGIEAMSHLANDFKNPKKDLIPAIIIGTALVGLIYIACTWLVLHFDSSNKLSMVGIFNQLFGGYGAIIIGILGIGGGLATVNVYTASLTRLIASFASDGYLPGYFAKTNTSGISVRALSSLLIVMATVILVTHFAHYDLEQLVGWVNGVFVIIYSASMLAAFKLLSNKYRPLIVMSCGFCLMLFWGLGWQMWYSLVLLAILAPLIHRKKSRAMAMAANT